MLCAPDAAGQLTLKPNPPNPGHRERVIVWCAVITTLLAVLAFFGVRQYTDFLRPARVGIAQTQRIDGGATPDSHPSNELPRQQPTDIGWSKVRCEPQSVNGSTSLITEASVSMAVEGFRMVNDRTVLRIAAESGHCCKSAYLMRPTKVYIADGDGEIYDLIEDRNVFRKVFGDSPNGREIRLHEKLRYELEFPKLRYATPFIYLHHEGFPDIKVYLQWNA